jgi:hypothetical protein
MRDPVQSDALPRAPTEGAGAGGRRAVRDPAERLREGEVRCPDPRCGKKLGEYLQGTYITTCPRCKRRVTITR